MQSPIRRSARRLRDQSGGHWRLLDANGPVGSRDPIKYDSIYHLSNGGTGDIGGWGAPQTLPMFIGKALTNDSPSDMPNMPDDDVVNMINTMLSKGEMPGCGLKGDSLQIGDSKLIGGYSYAVIGMAQQDGHAYVELRNPWGSDAGSLGNNHDGITFVFPRAPVACACRWA